MTKQSIETSVLEAYCRAIENDYNSWNTKANRAGGVTWKGGQFKADYTVGRTYIRVFTYWTDSPRNRSVHSFIVNKNVKSFTIGQVLKASSWAAPALNYARGDVADLHNKNLTNWTGAK